MSTGRLQGAFGPGAARVCLQHNQGDWQAVVSSFKGIFGAMAVHRRSAFEDSDTALPQFGILKLRIHHQISVYIAETGHGAGGDHV